MISVSMIMIVVIVILMMMLFQWRVDGSVDIPTQDSDLSDEPIKEAVSRSALRTRGTLGGTLEVNPLYISRCLASKGEVNCFLCFRDRGIRDIKSQICATYQKDSLNVNKE